MRHPAPSPDFTSLGHDDLLGCDIQPRKRTFSPDLLATFPAVPGSSVPTIVIAEALDAPEETREAARDAYIAARHRLAKAAGDRNERYLAFQLWQEGAARYTELALARLVAMKLEPSLAFCVLEGFVPFLDVATEIKKEMREDLARGDLPTRKRVAFYAFGCGEALLLDRSVPGWRKRYLASRFQLESPVGR